MPKLSESMLDKFWIRIAALFGHAWVSQYGDTPEGVAGETWAAALAGLSGAQLADGLRETMKLGSDWPPSAPRFRMLCLSLPSLAQVRHDLRKQNRDRMPFTRLTWEFLDGYSFAQAPQDKADRMLREAYDLTREHVMNGGALPEEVRYLEQAAAERPKPADPETVRKHLAEIRAALRAGDSSEGEKAEGETAPHPADDARARAFADDAGVQS